MKYNSGIKLVSSDRMFNSRATSKFQKPMGMLFGARHNNKHTHGIIIPPPSYPPRPPLILHCASILPSGIVTNAHRTWERDIRSAVLAEVHDSAGPCGPAATAGALLQDLLELTLRSRSTADVLEPENGAEHLGYADLDERSVREAATECGEVHVRLNRPPRVHGSRIREVGSVIGSRGLFCKVRGFGQLLITVCLKRRVDMHQDAGRLERKEIERWGPEARTTRK